MQTNPFYSLYTIYKHDMDMLAEHGLNISKNFTLEHAKEKYVGRIKTDSGSIRIWVMAYPAKFWRFEIRSKETGRITRVSTGSGSIEEYLNMALMILDGMFVVKEVKEIK